MKQTCLKCKTIVEIDETLYAPGMIVKEECPVCGEQLEFVVPNQGRATPTSPISESVLLVNESAKEPTQPKPDRSKSIPDQPVSPKISIKALIGIIFAIIIIGVVVFFVKQYNDKEYRCQIEAKHNALKDSCNVHFKMGLLDECHEDIEQMKVLERTHTWLKSFSDSYSNTLDSLESKRQRIPKTN